MQILATSPSQNEMIGFDFNPWNPNDNVISTIKPRDVPEAEVPISILVSVPVVWIFAPPVKLISPAKVAFSIMCACTTISIS